MIKKRLLLLLLLPIFSFGFSNAKSENKPVLTRNYVQIVNKSSYTAADFIEYWTNDFRSDHETKSICDKSKEQYEEMISNYNQLDNLNKSVVNETADPYEPDYTIGHMIKQLINHFYPSNQKVNDNKPKLDQSTTIIIAVVVSIFGMSAISVLYILKKDKVIE